MPEAYTRLEVAESALTILLRRQAREEEEALRRGRRAAARLLGAHAPGCGSNVGGVVQVRVHIPPFGDKAPPVELQVPATMRVAELQQEVVKHCCELKPLVQAAGYELRLLDEEDGAPDLDAPPFDRSLQVGCLGATDLALCEATSCPWGSTPPSPPLTAPCAADEAAELSAAAATPEALGGGVVGRRELATLLLGQTQGLRAPLAAAEAQDAMSQCHMVLTERPAAERPSPPVLSGGSGTFARQEGPATPAPPPLVPLPAGQPKAAGALSAVGGPIAADGEARAPAAAAAQSTSTQPRSSLRRTQSEPHNAQYMHVVTFGGFESLTATTSEAGPRSSRPGNSTGPSAGAGGRPSAPPKRTLKLVLPEVAEAPGHAAPAGVELELGVSPEATLHEVLAQLSRVRGRAYDPVSFAIERPEGGLRQRLDLEMQVKHLQSSTDALVVVRKDAPVSPTPRTFDRLPTPSGFQAHKPGTPPQHPDAHLVPMLPRPPSTSFFLSEFAASIATEYLVTTWLRGQRPRAADCTLVVDRERLYHRAVRASAAPPERPDRRKAYFVPPLLQKLGRHLPKAEGSRTARPDPSPDLHLERDVRNIVAISAIEGQPRALCVTYAAGAVRDAGVGQSAPQPAEIVYEAQTQTECAEIAARLRFLQMMLLGSPSD